MTRHFAAHWPLRERFGFRFDDFVGKARELWAYMNMYATPRAVKAGAFPALNQWQLSGGVAANSALRAAFLAWSERTGIPAHIPHMRFCTDNAAMIAAAADRQGEAVRADALTLTADPSLPFTFD